MSITLQAIEHDLKSLANPEKAIVLARYFKTAKGQYGHGDIFIGLTVPQIRTLAKKYQDCDISTAKKLLYSPIHEQRLLALILLVNKFSKSKDLKTKQNIYKYYLKNTKYINNWDLVDLTAGHIVGGNLNDQKKGILKKLARSKNLWERRIAIISTFYFIIRGHSEYTLELAEILLTDQHDLIHKAVGWMLREVGKRCSVQILENFLDKHAALMPRTMLRYAIERLPRQRRVFYLTMKKTSH